MSTESIQLEIERIRALVQEQKDLIENIDKIVKPDIDKFIANKSIPLDERWTVFSNLPNHLANTSSWIEHYDELENIPDFSWFDTFYISKHEEVNMIDIVDLIEREEYESISEALAEDPEKLNRLKEEILQQGYVSFIFDW